MAADSPGDDGLAVLSPDALAASILQVLAHETTSYISVVAIDGHYGAGKSTLAKLLCTYWTFPCRQSPLVISTDDFMRFARRDRDSSQNACRSHIDWYNLVRVADVLRGIKRRGDALHLSSLYNHATGDLDRCMTIKPGDHDMIVLEGMYAAHDSLRRHVDFRILLVADHNTLLNRVLDRDRRERGLSEEYVRQRYNTVNCSAYEAFVSASVAQVDLVLDTRNDRLEVRRASTAGAEVVRCCGSRPHLSRLAMNEP